MKQAIALFCVSILVASGAALNYEMEFLDFIQKYNKVYADDAELLARFDIFKSNLDMIESHNKKGLSWTLGVNKFADLTREEFSAGRLGYVESLESNYVESAADLSGLYSLPSEVDWNAKGAVTPVVNQHQCGSSWAFSALGAVEGAHAIAKGELVAVSVQELLDCDTTGDDRGCNGGFMTSAYMYILENGGITAESDYPYTGDRAQPCLASKYAKAATISSFVVVKPNEDELLAAVAHQPVGTAVKADTRDFQFYTGGVFTAECGTQSDHGIMVSGYGTDNGIDYWTLKNTWGSDWGESGFIRIERNRNNGRGLCGVALSASYPVV